MTHTQTRPLLVLLLLAAAAVGCGGPPAMGEDKKVFNGVDALYTAVTARDPKLLDQCEKNLQRLKEQGRLPEAAWSSLSAVIRQARDGRWQPAAEDLAWFMKGQRRAGR